MTTRDLLHLIGNITEKIGEGEPPPIVEVIRFAFLPATELYLP